MTKLSQYLKMKESWTIPALLTLVIYIPLLIWLKLDNSLPHWDMGRHLYNSVEYGRLWADFVAGRGTFRHLLTSYFYYPPLFYQVGLIFYLFFGITLKVAIASNLVWQYILVYSVYHLARQKWNKKTAVLSVAVLFSMPMIIGALHEYQLDLPLTAWVALTYLLLYQYQAKPDSRKAVWIGVALGLGMLLKWTFVIFALPLAIWALAIVIRNKKISSRKIISSVAAALIVAIILTGAWYITNRSSIRADFVANGIEAAKQEGDPVGLTIPALTFYLKSLSNLYLLLPLGIITLLGLIFSFFRKERFTKNLAPIIMIVFIYLVFSLLPNKDSRYIMPMAPFLAILAASLLNFIPAKRWQVVLVASLMLIFGLNNLTTSFNTTGGRDISLAANLPILRGSSYTSGAPRSEFCPMANIVSSIPQGASARLVGNNPIEFNNWALGFYLESSGRSWAGESQNAEDSDFWIVRLDGSLQSKQVLFEYQDRALIVDNYNCTDHSLVIIMKNAARAQTYLPKY